MVVVPQLLGMFTADGAVEGDTGVQVGGAGVQGDRGAPPATTNVGVLEGIAEYVEGTTVGGGGRDAEVCGLHAEPGGQAGTGEVGDLGDVLGGGCRVGVGEPWCKAASQRGDSCRSQGTPEQGGATDAPVEAVGFHGFLLPEEERLTVYLAEFDAMVETCEARDRIFLIFRPPVAARETLM